MNFEKSGSLGLVKPHCPKQPWVMATFADDERLLAKGAIPSGLVVHLRQCPSCRAVADKLQRATSQLQRLATLGVPETLQHQGDLRVTQAIREGGRLTRRYETPDLEESACSHRHWPLSTLRWPLAAAAVLMVGVGVASWFSAADENARPTAITANEPVWPFDDDVFGDAAQTNPSERVRTGEAGSVDAPPGMAGAAGSKVVTTSAARRHRHRPVVWYSSHIEAAMTDSPGTIQAAVVMPHRRDTKRHTNWRDLFDRPGGFLFTTSPRDKE
ncbi:MAG: hypothetical protein ACE5E5_03930 [Phycisphaerae bacterium]